MIIATNDSMTQGRFVGAMGSNFGGDNRSVYFLELPDIEADALIRKGIARKLNSRESIILRGA
jgi:hypothetical protein